MTFTRKIIPRLSNRIAKTNYITEIDGALNVKDKKNNRMKFSHKLASQYFSTNKKVLDIGCGIGEYLIFIQDKNTCFGLDSHDEVLNIAQKNCSKVKFLNSF